MKQSTPDRRDVPVLRIPPDEDHIAYEIPGRRLAECGIPLVDREDCYVVKVRSEGILIMDGTEGARRWYLCRCRPKTWTEVRKTLQETAPLRGLRWRSVPCETVCSYGESRPTDGQWEYRTAAAPKDAGDPDERALDLLAKEVSQMTAEGAERALAELDPPARDRLEKRADWLAFDQARRTARRQEALEAENRAYAARLASRIEPDESADPF